MGKSQGKMILGSNDRSKRASMVDMLEVLEQASSHVLLEADKNSVEEKELSAIVKRIADLKHHVKHKKEDNGQTNIFDFITGEED